MKKKMAILALTATMVFSGLSITAAAADCGHPSSTTYYAQENRASNCTQHGGGCKDVYNITAVVCHSCGGTFHKTETYSHTVHN